MTADQTSARTSTAAWRTRRSVVVRDVVVSAVALALAGGVVASGVVRAFALAGHLGRCVACSPSGAMVSVGGPVVVAVAAGFAGLVLTALRLVDRRPAWPFALVTLVVCALAVGIERYAAPVLPLT